VEAAPGLRVLTRENMLALLQGRSMVGCEAECAVQAGRRLGADWVISGDVLRSGAALEMSLRLHETRSGRLAAGAQASGTSLEALDARIAGAAQQLVSVILGQPPPVSAPSPAPPPPPPSPPSSPANPNGPEVELRGLAIIADRDINFLTPPTADVPRSERVVGGGMLLGGAFRIAPFGFAGEVGLRAGLQLRAEVYRLTTATLVGTSPLQYSTQARVALATPVVFGIDINPGEVTSFGVAYAPEVFYDLAPTTVTFVAGRVEGHGDVARVGAGKVRLGVSYAARTGTVPAAATVGLGIAWQ
jgi:hypothetical protein